MDQNHTPDLPFATDEERDAAILEIRDNLRAFMQVLQALGSNPMLSAMLPKGALTGI